ARPVASAAHFAKPRYLRRGKDGDGFRFPLNPRAKIFEHLLTIILSYVYFPTPRPIRGRSSEGAQVRGRPDGGRGDARSQGWDRSGAIRPGWGGGRCCASHARAGGPSRVVPAPLPWGHWGTMMAVVRAASYCACVRYPPQRWVGSGAPPGEGA